MSARRSKLEIMLNVLGTIERGIDKPTRIMYSANMSWNPTQKVLDKLVKEGRRILLILAAVTVVVVLTMILTFFKMLNVANILSMVTNDQLIIGAAVLGIGGIAFLLWRRFRG